MKFDPSGWPEGGPQLRLDYRRFAYAGKFVTTAAGETVFRDPGDSLPSFDDGQPALTGGLDSLSSLTEDVATAVASNENRADPTVLWLRYVAARRDHRNDRSGPDLLRRTRDAIDRGHETVCIVTSNPFAREARHKTGFGFTSRETGITELISKHPVGVSVAVSHETYQSSLDRYRARDPDNPRRAFFTTRERVESPEIDAGYSDD